MGVYLRLFGAKDVVFIRKREIRRVIARLGEVSVGGESTQLMCLFHFLSVQEMFKTIDEDDDNRMDAFELLVMVSAAMETEIGADLNLAKHVLEGARDEFGELPPPIT